MAARRVPRRARRASAVLRADAATCRRGERLADAPRSPTTRTSPAFRDAARARARRRRRCPSGSASPARSRSGRAGRSRRASAIDAALAELDAEVDRDPREAPLAASRSVRLRGGAWGGARARRPRGGDGGRDRARAGGSSRRRSSVIGVFFVLPVLAALALSLTDFDIYALADLDDAALRRPAQLRARCCRAAVLAGARQHALLRASSACPLRSRSSLGAALLRERARCARGKALFAHGAFRARGHDAGRGGGGLALPATPALRPDQLRARHVGIAPVDWLGDPHWSMPAIILFAVWKNFGYNMIIFLAALQSIPRELYEAARSTAPAPCSSSATSRCRCSRRRCACRHHDDGRLLPAVRRAVRDDPGRPAAQHDERRATSCTRKASAGGAWASRRRSPSCCSSSSSSFTRRAARGCRRARRRARERRAASAAPATIALHRRCSCSARCSLPRRCCGWSRPRSCRRAKRAPIPPPLLPHACRRSSTTATCSRRLGLGRYCAQQRARRDGRDASSRSLSTSTAGYAFAKLRFRGRDAHLPGAARRARDPGAGRDAAAVPDAQVAGAGQHLRRRDRARRWRASSASSSCASTRSAIPDDLLEAARIDGASEFAHLPVDRAAGAQAGPGDAGALHLPRHLERLHVAADRAERRPQYTLPVALAGLVARARAGRRADDGRRRWSRCCRCWCCSWCCSATTSRESRRGA